MHGRTTTTPRLRPDAASPPWVARWLHLNAAEGGADRRSAKNAARPIDQSREAHRSAWPLHSPRGGMTSGNGALGRRGGTRVAGVGSSVGFRVGSSVGSRALGPGGTGPRPAGLRSLPAKQHAPKARPLPTTDCGRHAGSRAGRQGRMAAPCRAARWRGAGHSPLTAGHRAPAAPRAFRRAWWPASRGEGPPPDPPPPRAARGQRVTVGW